MIRVVLVDDQHLVRAGLRMLCESSPDVEVVDEASSGHEAVRSVDRHRPDVVLMDLRMPGLDGIAATSRILAQHPATKVVVLTTFDDDDHLYPALIAGATGFLVKDAAPAELLDAVRRAAGGDSPFSPTVLRRLLRSAITNHVPAAERSILSGLTRREGEVLTCLGEGLSNVEIAERLHVGVTTVKTHVASVMAKTGIDSRVRLALLVSRTRHAADLRGGPASA